jgi:hypothetical protein
MSKRRGFYFLANDYVLERVIAFLNSFRMYNETAELCLIPFDDDIDGVLRLQSRYDFSVWSGDPALLRTCDDISREFHDEVKGHYRKLACWEGDFDEFVYVDTDTIVLRDMDFLFDYLDRYGFFTTISDHPGIFEWVWKDSIRQTGALTEQQWGYSASTGLIASRKECLRFADVQPRLPAAIELAPHMALVTLEMPPLNYLMVTSGWPYGSLAVLSEQGGVDGGPDPNIPLECHAAQPVGEIRDGRIISPAVPPIFLVHWAGMWWQLERGEREQIPYYDLWSHYRYLDQLAGRP